MAAVAGRTAPHRCAVCSPNITSDYANRRTVTALATKIVIKSRCRQAPRQRVASHNQRSCCTGCRRFAPGSPRPRTSACSGAHVHVRAPFVTHCALRVDAAHRFGHVIATRLHACCARLHSCASATRTRLARVDLRPGRLNAARSSRTRITIPVTAANSGQQGGIRVATRTSPPRASGPAPARRSQESGHRRGAAPTPRSGAVDPSSC